MAFPNLEGRPKRYDDDAKRAIIEAYEELPRGEKIKLAEHLGISFNVLMVYISNWRKEFREREDAEGFFGAAAEESVADTEV